MNRRYFLTTLGSATAGFAFARAAYSATATAVPSYLRSQASL